MFGGDGLRIKLNTSGELLGNTKKEKKEEILQVENLEEQQKYDEIESQLESYDFNSIYNDKFRKLEIDQNVPILISNAQYAEQLKFILAMCKVDDPMKKKYGIELYNDIDDNLIRVGVLALTYKNVKALYMYSTMLKLVLKVGDTFKLIDGDAMCNLP